MPNAHDSALNYGETGDGFAPRSSVRLVKAAEDAVGYAADTADSAKKAAAEVASLGLKGTLGAVANFSAVVVGAVILIWMYRDMSADNRTREQNYREEAKLAREADERKWDKIGDRLDRMSGSVEDAVRALNSTVKAVTPKGKTP